MVLAHKVESKEGTSLQGDGTHTPQCALHCLGSCGKGERARACHLLRSQPALQHLQATEQLAGTFLRLWT
jgi:hypothetical protein